jgi:hypothetical protein
MCFAAFPALQIPAARSVGLVLEEKRRDTLSKSLLLSINPSKEQRLDEE